MREKLIHSLLRYIKENNPDFLLGMDNETLLMQWLSDKVKSVNELVSQLKRKRVPEHQIEEACMEAMTKELRPSRFNYISEILQAEFEQQFQLMFASGVLRFEIVNMIGYCKSTFDDLRFAEENEDNRFTRYAITGMINEYLQEQSVEGGVRYGLQQPAEAQG